MSNPVFKKAHEDKKMKKLRFDRATIEREKAQVDYSKADAGVSITGEAVDSLFNDICKANKVCDTEKSEREDNRKTRRFNLCNLFSRKSN